MSYFDPAWRAGLHEVAITTRMHSDAATAHRRGNGFTIIELVVVLVFVGIISAFVLLKGLPRAGDSTSSYQQAQRLASDLRHAQMLALAWGKGLTFSAAGASYSVACATGFTGGPCGASPVIDPGRDGPFTVNLDSVNVNTASVTFDILGKPLGPQSFTLSSGGTVSVAADTGFVTLQ
jgi:prepilin-type N-terminal cleavage/methylation domain-containing protein